MGQVARLEQVKIDKEDVLTLIPTTEPRDLVREEIKEQAAYLSKNMNELGRAWDLKLVKLRNDLDLHSIRKEISTKANDDEVRREIQSQEYKMGNLERSVFNGAAPLMRHSTLSPLAACVLISQAESVETERQLRPQPETYVTTHSRSISQ